MLAVFAVVLDPVLLLVEDVVGRRRPRGREGHQANHKQAMEQGRQKEGLNASQDAIRP